MSERENRLMFQIVLIIVIMLTIGSMVTLGLIPVAVETLFYAHFDMISLIFVFMIMVYLIGR